MVLNKGQKSVEAERYDVKVRLTFAFWMKNVITS